jgi:hypothetical protein
MPRSDSQPVIVPKYFYRVDGQQADDHYVTVVHHLLVVRGHPH